MADEVAKLYASIGFKVNQKELNDAKNLLKSFASELSNVSKNAREFVRKSGLQEYQKQRDKERKAEEKAQKDAFRERIKTDKLIAKHEEQQNKLAEKNARERTARLKRMADGFKSFAISVSNALVGGTQGLLALTAESRQRAVNIRDFQFETGIGFDDLQRLRRQFNIIGSGLKSEDIMGDLASVQQNLVDISLGKGNISGYKLAGVRAAAGQGSVLNVIEELRKVAQTQDVDNATLINIMRDMGIKNAGQWLLNFRNVRGDDERTRQSQLSAEQETAILQAEISLRQFNEAIRNVKDQITAGISPLFREIVDKWKKRFEDFAISLKNSTSDTEGFRKGMEVLMKTGDGLIEAFSALTNIVIEKVIPAISDFGEWIAEKLWPDRKPKEGFLQAKEYEKNIIEWGKKGFAGLKEGDISDEIMAEGLFGRGIASAKKFYETLSNKDRITEFNNDRRISGKTVYNASDNHVTNVTINGVYQDELKEEMVNAIEEHDQKTGVYGINNRVSDISQLWVVGHSANASVGR